MTFDEYRWAVSTVMTRQNLLPGTDGKGINTLIPFWDMANHDQVSARIVLLLIYLKRTSKIILAAFTYFNHRPLNSHPFISNFGKTHF